MNKKIIVPIILIALTSCSNENFISSSSSSSSFVSSSSSVYSISSEIKDEYKIVLDEIAGEVNIHQPIQDEFLESPDIDLKSLGINGSKELSLPEAINLSWKSTLPKDKNFDYFLVRIDENNNFTLPLEYKVPIEENNIDIYNLKVGTKYYWNVEAIANEESITSEIETFTTFFNYPRNIFVEGVTNFRDVGGWIIDENTRVRQGLAYHCGRLNTSSSSTLNIEITDNGINTMRNYLNIKSEIDLRLIENNEVGSYEESALGSGINYYQCPMSYDGNILVNNKNMVKNIFDLLSDKTNYPLIYHCNIGTDRTGLITYLLNGLLGVNQEDLFIDYEFSNFGLINGTRSKESIKKTYVKTIDETEGETLSEKISNYLQEIGITSNQIETIKEIFIEKY